MMGPIGMLLVLALILWVGVDIKLIPAWVAIVVFVIPLCFEISDAIDRYKIRKRKSRWQ